MDPISSADLRLPGWLLLVGGALGIIGAFCPPYRQWSGTQEEGFRAIAGNPLGWWCIHIGFFSGTVLSALGLATLASILYRRTGGQWALSAAVAYGIAGVAWITNIAYRLSIWNWAAQAFVATGTTPELFLPLRRFAGVLFGIFSVVGYASVACLGAAVLCAQLASAWLGWAIVACGISAGYIVGYNVPLIMYVPFVALGIALLG
ncbi:MAG TPA: hypothetical protein VL137_16810 [Polyangiaceae bacterium]|nr:hypothetical protein [Polyangiaceae bacterium]